VEGTFRWEKQRFVTETAPICGFVTHQFLYSVVLVAKSLFVRAFKRAGTGTVKVTPEKRSIDIVKVKDYYFRKVRRKKLESIDILRIKSI